MRHNVEM